MKESEVYDKLESAVGSRSLSKDKVTRWCYAADSVIYDNINPTPPSFVVTPSSTGDVKEIIRIANETKTPVYPRGGGTQGSGTRGERVKEAILIDMTNMREVKKIDEDSLTVTAQAGTTWGKINKEVEGEGWRLGFKGPYSGYGSTIGGSFSFQSNGYGSPRYGVLAEEVTNIKAVLPNSDVLETGTLVNPDANAYYRYANGPDLAGLFSGAIGTMGVVTEVSMRMYPESEKTVFGAYAFDDIDSAQECYYNWVKHDLATHNLWFARDGIKVMVPEIAEQGYNSMLTFVVDEVDEDITDSKAHLLDNIANDAGADTLDPDYAKPDWDYKFETLPRWAAKIGQWQWCCHLASAGRTGEDLKAVLNYLSQYDEEAKEKDVHSATISLSHKNAGHVSTSVYYDESNPESVELAKEMAEGYVEVAAKHGACPYKPGKLWYDQNIGKAPVYKETVKKIKKALDPNNIMNPGALLMPLEWEEE